MLVEGKKWREMRKEQFHIKLLYNPFNFRGNILFNPFNGGNQWYIE